MEKITDRTNTNEHIIQAYDASEFAYRIVWKLEACKALHYGYTDETTQSFADTLQRMNEVICNRANISATDTVLDAGCGVGGSCVYLAKVVGCHVTGVSLSARQIELAKRYANLERVSNLTHFEVADFLKLPFPDASFSVVWALESMFHTPDKRAFFAEMRRVLKPGGRLVIADYLEQQRPATPHESSLLLDWFEGYAIPGLLPWHVLTEYLAAEQFTHLHCRDLTRFIEPSSRRLYRYGKLADSAWGVSRIWLRQRGLQRAQFRSLVAQHEALKAELWSYGLLYAEKKD